VSLFIHLRSHSNVLPQRGCSFEWIGHFAVLMVMVLIFKLQRAP